MDIQLSQYYLLKRLCISSPWHICCKSIDKKYAGLFWVPNFISLICVYLDCCSFVVSFEIRNYESHGFFFFFNIVLAILSTLGFHMNFKISLSIYTKKSTEILDRIVLNLYVNLGNVALLIRVTSSNP